MGRTNRLRSPLFCKPRIEPDGEWEPGAYYGTRLITWDKQYLELVLNMDSDSGAALVWFNLELERQKTAF